MRFSIITVCKNSCNYLERTIKSVIAQCFTDYEYIIIDGQSNDKTIDIIEKYYDRISICISEEDNGISDAFNKGVSFASGDYVLFLNAGDTFLNEGVLNIVNQTIDEVKNDIYTFQIITSMGYMKPQTKAEGEKDWRDARIPHQASFIRRDVFERVGMFNEVFKVRMDYEFFKRCLDKNIECSIFEVPIVYYDGSGISSTNKYLYEKEGLAIRLIYDREVEKSERETLDYIIKLEEAVDENDRYDQLVKKDRRIISALYYYLQLRNSGVSLSTSLIDSGYRRIAIYGFGFIGKALYDDLSNNGVDVLYVIDKTVNNSILVRSFEDDWDEVDCIIVTPVYAFDSIKNEIERKVDFVVLSFEEILASNGLDKIRF